MLPLHIFCDESGGADDERGCFVVAAVALALDRLAHLGKPLRKAARATGEVKGGVLGADERRRVFGLLRREAGVAAAAVVCLRGTPLGGWAAGTLAEPDLYTHMAAEAASALHALLAPGPPAASLSMTLDGGRYKQTVQRDIASRLADALTTRLNRPLPRVDFGDSAATVGLQVADVFANTVYRCEAPPRGGCPASTKVVTEWRAEGLLTVRPIELATVRPNWLGEKVG